VTASILIANATAVGHRPNIVPELHLLLLDAT